jgi:hypothetical protein
MKNIYIGLLKLLLKVVAAGIEAIVVSGNKFCMPASKKSAACEFVESVYEIHYTAAATEGSP